MAKEEQEQSPEQILLEGIQKVINDFRQSSETARSIARDTAERLVEILDDTSEKAIQNRQSEQRDFERWKTRAGVYEEAVNKLVSTLETYKWSK